MGSPTNEYAGADGGMFMRAFYSFAASKQVPVSYENTPVWLAVLYYIVY